MCSETVFTKESRERHGQRVELWNLITAHVRQEGQAPPPTSPPQLPSPSFVAREEHH